MRSDFPILSQMSRGHPLVYLDNAASAQKPRHVIDAISTFYSTGYANIHRGVYELSESASGLYEGVRQKTANYLGSRNSREIVFTRGTTESINLVAHSFGRRQIKPGAKILVTRMEHHSNFIAWQQLAKERDCQFEIVELTADLELDLNDLEKKLRSGNVAFLAITAMSNVTGIINPINEIAKLAASVDAKILVDGAQWIVHSAGKISELGLIDFFAFSGHKLYGPTGVGVLWARESLLESMPPYQLGGGMIARVEDQATMWNESPWKFEAGTPDIASVVGMGAVWDYLDLQNRQSLHAKEIQLASKFETALKEIPEVQLYGAKVPFGQRRGPIVSFSIKGVHAHDLASFFDLKGICIRAGHHCAQPLMRTLGAAATARVSPAFYNTEEEILMAIETLKDAARYFEKRNPL